MRISMQLTELTEMGTQQRFRVLDSALAQGPLRVQQSNVVAVAPMLATFQNQAPLPATPQAYGTEYSIEGSIPRVAAEDNWNPAELLAVFMGDYPEDSRAMFFKGGDRWSITIEGEDWDS